MILNKMKSISISYIIFQITPFWPETNSMKMYVKLKDSSLVSQHFFINQECQTVLRMDRGVTIYELTYYFLFLDIIFMTSGFCCRVLWWSILPVVKINHFYLFFVIIKKVMLPLELTIFVKTYF